jgi:hypothetical protein
VQGLLFRRERREQEAQAERQRRDDLREIPQQRAHEGEPRAVHIGHLDAEQLLAEGCLPLRALH